MTTTTFTPYHDEAGRQAWASLIDDPVAAPHPVPSLMDPATEQPSRVDQVLTWGAKKAKLCGYGAPMNWSVRFADALYVDCGCCWCLRCAFVGTAISAPSGALVAWFFMRFL